MTAARGGSAWWAWLGALLGILAAAVVLLHAGRDDADAKPPARAGLLPEATGMLAVVAMQYSPTLAGEVREPYVDFLRAIEPDVRVIFVVGDDRESESRAGIGGLVAEADGTGALAKRMRVVVSPGPITTWSKDRALVAGPVAVGMPHVLIAPAEPSARWPARHNDWLTIESIARQSGGEYRAETAPLDFDAGDFAVAGDRVLVDANLLEKNRHRGIGDVIELRKRLTAWLGTPVAVLGKSAGDTPRHHLSMYMTPLDGNVVLVGDPGRAKALVGEGYRPGQVGAESGEPLVADFSEATSARFELVAAELARLGYRVERIPNVPFDDKTYVAYTNGVYETRGGRRIAYVPMYGMGPLDEEARAVYERLGWEVRPVRAARIYAYHGTIGCLVNVLKRR